MLDWTEIIVAAISMVGVTFSAYFAMKAKKRTDEHQLERQLQKSAFSFSEYLMNISQVDESVRKLFEETPIDRFLILRAWNGRFEPKWTSAVYQMRMEGQKYVQYLHFELDEDYKARLRNLLTRSSLVFSVDDVPDSRIKDVYNLEGVKHSAWFLVDERNLDEVGAKAITYCSFSTHEDEPLDPSTLTKCALIVNELKAASFKFHGVGHDT